MQFPMEYQLIAPFYADIDTRGVGQVYWRASQQQEDITRAANLVAQYYDDKDFTPREVVVVSWDQVGYFDSKTDKTNMIQLIIASDGMLTFTVFLYPESGIQWVRGSGRTRNQPDTQAQAGFMSGEGQHYLLTLLSRQGELLTFSCEDEQGQQQLLRVARHAAGDKRQAWVNGNHYQYQHMVSGRSAGPVADAMASLAPTIPSIVTQILVEPGQTVESGEKLILLESMKMVIPIQAPYAGTVTELHCAAGDAVEPGKPLLQLTPVEAEE